MSDGHWNCWIFTNGGKESRFSIEVIHSLVVHAIMTVRISIVLKNTVIFTFRGVPLLYCYNCQFQHSQYCFAINEKNNQGYKIHVHVKKGLYGLKYFFVSEFYSVSFQLSMWSLIASYSWTQDELGLNE